MIINFDQNSDYYFQNAITAKENGDYLKSFKYIHEAISKEESSEYTLFLASLYMDIEEYDEALDLAFSLLAEKQNANINDIYLLISKCLLKENMIMDSCEYLALHAEKSSDVIHLQEVSTIISRLQKELSKASKNEELLYITSNKKAEQEQELYQNVEFLLETGRYRLALETLETIEHKNNSKGLNYKARCMYFLEEKGIEELWKILLDTKTADGYVLSDIVKSNFQIERAKDLLLNFESKDNDEILKTIEACIILQDYEMGKSLLKKLCLHPINIKKTFVDCVLEFNLGDKKKAQEILQDILAIHPYLPKGLINDFLNRKKLSIPYDDIPEEMIYGIVKEVEKSFSDHNEFKEKFVTDSSFRKAVQFCLTQPLSQSFVEALVVRIEMFSASTQIFYDFLKKMLLSYKVTPLARIALLKSYIFLEKNFRVKYLSRSFIKQVNLKKLDFVSKEKSPLLWDLWAETYANVLVIDGKFGKNLLDIFKKKLSKLKIAINRYSSEQLIPVLLFLSVDGVIPLEVFAHGFEVDIDELSHIIGELIEE